MDSLDRIEKLFEQIGKKGTDNVLQLISQVLLKAVRTEDSLSRWGHATFLLSMPTANPETVKELAERLCKTVSNINQTYAFKALI